MLTVCHSSTLDSRLLDLNSTEQSENVYENKGPLWKNPLVAGGGRPIANVSADHACPYLGRGENEHG